jgi:hypothetical protein
MVHCLLHLLTDTWLIQPTMALHVVREKERSRRSHNFELRQRSSFYGPAPPGSLAGALLNCGVWQGFSRSRRRSRLRSPAKRPRSLWWAASPPRPCLVPNLTTQIALCKKKILHHIKMSANAWSTKCRWNQKLIAQFCCTLRDEHFESN